MIDAKKLQSALNKNAKDATQQINTIRNSFQQIDDELYWLENSPLPLSDALENITKFVQKNSNKTGIKHFFHQHKLGEDEIFESVVKLGFGQARVLDHGAVTGSTNVDISEILCSLFGSTIEKSLQDIAKKAAKDIESGPPLAERPKIKDEILKKKHILEVEEERLIELSEELGLHGFYRRPDCNPEIVLMTSEE